jgi:hypothetical protein
MPVFALRDALHAVGLCTRWGSLLGSLGWPVIQGPDGVHSIRASKFFFFFFIILYSSYIAYDKPSYLLDDFSGFYLCSRVDHLPYNPARYPDFNKPPQLLGSRPSYVYIVVMPYVSPHPSSSPVVLSSPSRSSLSISHESHLFVPSGSFLPTSVLSMY